MNKRISLIIISLAILAITSTVSAADIGIKQFTDLRMQYVQRPDFSPLWDMGESRDTIFSARYDGKLDEALELSGKWLKEHPLDAEVHLLRSFIYRAKNDMKGYFHHYYIYTGLLASIASSGDGLSMKTAMKVTSVAEEYFIIRALEGQTIQQSVVSDENGMYDKMDCKIDDKEITLYFDISIPMNAYNRMFQKKEEKEEEKAEEQNPQ